MAAPGMLDNDSGEDSEDEGHFKRHHAHNRAPQSALSPSRLSGPSAPAPTRSAVSMLPATRSSGFMSSEREPPVLSPFSANAGETLGANAGPLISPGSRSRAEIRAVLEAEVQRTQQREIAVSRPSAISLPAQQAVVSLTPSRSAANSHVQAHSAGGFGNNTNLVGGGGSGSGNVTRTDRKSTRLNSSHT